MGNILEFYNTNERFKDKVNMDVIRFIDEVNCFPDRDGKENDSIDHLFCAGYCYYFANMLKIAFGGRICYAQDRGHIVWVDCDEDVSFEELQKACAYDITGVFDDYERLWPVEYLGDIIVDYMHNGKEFHVSESFKDWCDFCKVTEAFAIDIIWGIIPNDDILELYKSGYDYVGTAYQYWILYEKEFQEIFKYIQKKQIKLIYPKHNGIKNFLSEIKEKHGC